MIAASVCASGVSLSQLCLGVISWGGVTDRWVELLEP